MSSKGNCLSISLLFVHFSAAFRFIRTRWLSSPPPVTKSLLSRDIRQIRCRSRVSSLLHHVLELSGLPLKCGRREKLCRWLPSPCQLPLLLLPRPRAMPRPASCVRLPWMSSRKSPHPRRKKPTLLLRGLLKVREPILPERGPAPAAVIAVEAVTKETPAAAPKPRGLGGLEPPVAPAAQRWIRGRQVRPLPQCAPRTAATLLLPWPCR